MVLADFCLNLGGGLWGGSSLLLLSFSPPRPPRPPKGTQVRPRPQNDSKMSPNGPQNAPKCSHFGPLSASFFALLSPVAAPKEKPRKKNGERSVLFFVKKAERSAGRVPARRTVGPPLEKKWRAFPPLFRQEKAALRRQSTRPGCCASQVAGRRSLVVGRRSRQKGTN